MKLLAKTTGAFHLFDPNTNDEIGPDRPYVIGMSAFVSSRAGIGQLTVLTTNLKDTATDLEFQKFVKASENPELAVASFLSKFGPEADLEKVDTEAAAKAKAKAAEAEAEAEAATKAKAAAEAATKAKVK